MKSVTRREFSVVAAVAGCALAGPTLAFARPARASPRDRRILEIARLQVERNEGLVRHRDIVGVGDFSAHSADERFHLADLHSGTVISVRVAHGTGSDPLNKGWLSHFSNAFGSNATSSGAYLTNEQFEGRYGTSLALSGVEPQNSNALDRSIVVHAADYCSASYLAGRGRLGRSNGSLAVGPKDLLGVIERLRGRRLIYAGCLEGL